jgi:hypothetical protein
MKNLGAVNTYYGIFNKNMYIAKNLGSFCMIFVDTAMEKYEMS